MSTADARAVVRRFHETINKDNLAIVDELVSPDYVSHVPAFVGHSQEEVRQHFAAMFEAFPDMRVTIEDMVAEGDKVAVRLAYHGTLPTGVMGRAESVTGTSLAILRVLDGRIMESWAEATTPRRVTTYGPNVRPHE